MTTIMYKVTIKDNNNSVLNVLFILYKNTAEYIAIERLKDGYNVTIEPIELITIEC